MILHMIRRMMLTIFWTLFAAKQLGIILCQDDYLMNGFANNQYGTRTAYFWRYPANQSIAENDLMYTEFGGKKCTAVHVNVVSRHGARYMTLDEMRAFTALHEKIKSELGNQSYAFINTWTNKYPESQAELMTYLGKKEMDHIGYSHGYRLRDLLVKASNGTSFIGGLVKFAATRITRTQTSAKLLLNGLSRGVLQRNETSVPIAIRDKILRFFENCSRYENVTANNPEILSYKDGVEMQLVTDDIVKKLQLNGSLMEVDVEFMWLLCAAELAIMDNSDWCTILTDHHREVLEYLNDLQDYYLRLYGYPVTAEMACPLVSDVFTEMDMAISGYDNNTDYTRGVFQIGHADTLMEFAASLGFFNDKIKFRADNYLQLQNRTFRNSVVDTFSSHFTFLLYNCGGTGSVNYALRLLFNGNSLRFPVCDSDICEYNTVRQAYKQSVEQCNWEGVCQNKRYF